MRRPPHIGTMRVEMVLGLKDVPGMLVKVLEPVSANGGNIVSVLHSRPGGDLVEVNLVFKVSDQQTLDRIIKALGQAKVQAKDVKVEGRKYYSRRNLAFILIGHVIDKDIQDTIDRLNEIGLVRDIDVRMNDPEEESAVLLKVNVDEDRMGSLMDSIGKICKRKEFLLIREVS